MKNGFIIMIAAFAFGLLAGTLISKENYLKKAVADLHEARTKMDVTGKDLEEALHLNRQLEKQNHDFTKLLYHLDSAAERKDADAVLREKKLTAALLKIQAGINRMKGELPTSGKLLQTLPTGNLTEVK